MKKWILGGAVAAAAAVAAILLLVEFEPKTPAEALKRGEAKVQRFYKLADLDPESTKREQDLVLARFRFVGEKWPEAPERAIADRRAAELLRTWGRLEEAFQAWRALGTADGLWTAAEMADRDLGRPEEAMALLEEFLSKHPNDPRADDAAWRIIELKVAAGRSKYAPADLMQAAEKFLKDFPTSDFKDRAMLLIADTLRDVKEYDAALRRYDQVIDLFEGKPAAAKALLEKGKILSEQLGRNKEAKETLEELEKKFPKSEQAREGRGVREGAEEKAGEEESAEKERDYLKERYGRPGGDLAGAATARVAPIEFIRDMIDQRVQIEHADLEVRPDPAARTASFSGTLRIRNEGDEKKTLRFQILPTFTITKASIGTAELKVEHKDARILLQLAAPLAKGAAAELRFEWTGGELGDGLPLRLGDEGYAAPGAVWYPITYPGDLHTGTVKVDVKGAVATVDGSKPVFSLFFAYGPYSAALKGPIRYLTVDSDAKRVATILDRSADIVAFYEKEFGPAHGPTLTLVDVDLPPGIGGISPAGMILLSREFMEGEADPTFLVAHEIAHQWWGNKVPVTLARTDYTPWLSEGLASHSESLYLEHRFPGDRSRHHLEKGAQIYLERTMKLRDDSIASCWYGHPEYVAVVYLKGASVLAMLRDEVGAAYSPGLRRYATECDHKESGLTDFRSAMEAEAKRDLRGWFAQWIENPGYPKLAVEADGATLVIRQEGRPFTLRIDVEIDGVTTFFDIARSEERFPLAKAPERIVLDPRGRILKRPGPRNEWIRK